MGNGSAPYGNYRPGVGNVGSYQVSGIPYITGSDIKPLVEHRVEFPYITKSITVIASASFGGSNQNTNIRIHFATTGTAAPPKATGVTVDPVASADSDKLIDRADAARDTIEGQHFVELNTYEDSMTFNVRAKEIYISCPPGGASPSAYKVVAELTNIPAPSSWHLTGSGISNTDPAAGW